MSVQLDTPTPPTPEQRRSRKRRIARIVGGCVGAIVLTAGGIAWWAVDEYVIDHVAISDVSAYEASVASTVARTATTTASAASSTASTASSASATSAASSTTATTAAASAAGAPVITDSSYTDGATTITITKHVTGTGSATVTYYVADVVLTDATALRSGFADNKYGENIVQNTSDIAAEVGAVFAINGDYYGFRDSGIMIRNGVVYRDDPARQGLAIYRDGHMEVYDETTTSADALLAAGVWNTLSFGPGLVSGGEIVAGIEDVEVDTNIGNHSIQGNQPRTALGVVAPNHFVFVVVDGRSTGYSRGVTLPELAQIFVDLGATEAYNLDGGGSSTMVFDGELVNNPLGKGKERGTSDILYIA